MKFFRRKKKDEDIKKDMENQGEKIDLKEGEKSIFEKRKRTLKDLISGDYDFTDPTKLTFGDGQYAKNMYVAFLPNSVNFASTFHPLYDFGNIDTSIMVTPIDNETAKAELSKLRTNLAVEYLTAGGSLNRMDDMEAKVQEAARLREEVRDGLNKLYEVTITSTLYADNETELNNNADRLREMLGQTDIGIRNAAYFQEEVFFSNKPICENLFDISHTFDKRSLACVFPFTSNNISHPNGTMIGINMDNALPVFYDNFDSSLANYNMFIFAQSGMGKSTLAKMLAARTSTIDNIQNIAIDIEPEYRDIAEILGGVNITIEPRGSTVINFFDVVVDLEEDEITKKLVEEIKLEDKINSVTNLLMVLARGYVGNNKYYDDIARSIIRECVAIEYEKIGITRDPESLYEYVDDSIATRKVKKRMPTLSSWYQTLENEAKKNEDNSTFKEYYDYLLKVMSNFVRIKDGGLTCFDGQTTSNVKLGYDIPFINFDLSRLNEKTELPLAQYIITDFIWEQMVKRNTGGHKLRVIIDEAWRLIKYEEALDFLVTMARRARKKNTSTCVITQQFEEFYSEETSPIIKQSYTKFFLKPDSTEIDRIQEVFKLTDGETAFLRTCNIGEVLMKTGPVSAKVKVVIPDFEMDFVQTNQNVLRNRNESIQGAI